MALVSHRLLLLIMSNKQSEWCLFFAQEYHLQLDLLALFNQDKQK